MQRGTGWYLVAPLVVLGLVGCRFIDFEERDPWRAEAEAQCLAGKAIQPSSFVEERPEVRDRGICGMTRPLQVAGIGQGFVAVEPKATLACPIVANVESWFEEAVQPAALAWFGEPVVQMKQISAYSCRTMNGQAGASISEHAFGNALDISTFRLESGREVNFKQGWKGAPEEQGFLRNIHAAACERFSTVLAPGADMFHYDHIHVDLMRRASDKSVCRPAAKTVRPPSAPMQRMPEGVPVARAPAQQQRDYVWQTPPPAGQASAALPGVLSTSPWSPPSQQAAPVRAAGPTVISREPDMRQDMRPVGPPLVLGNQAPPPNSFGAQAPIAERVRQSLGIQPQGAPMQAPPAAMPGRPNPYGLVPPGRIPSARTGADPTVTGSIAPAARAANLMSPQPVAEQAPGAEPASVFNLLPAKD